jgi:hypothetical protein
MTVSQKVSAVRGREMIRTIVGLAVAGIALAPFADKSAASKPEAAQSDAPWVAEYGVDPIVTSAGVPTIRHLKVATSVGQCMLSVTDTAAIVAEPSCGHVHAGLEKASVWKVNGASAAIADASGRVILEVGASDGFAYEGTSAAGGVVTLTEADD